MATTIQISTETKKELDKYKGKQTYDALLRCFLQKEKKEILREQIRDYYAQYGQEDADEVNEWIHTETK